MKVGGRTVHEHIRKKSLFWPNVESFDTLLYVPDCPVLTYWDVLILLIELLLLI